VGGAITQSRHRSLACPRNGKATGARKKARGCAATVGFRQNESPTPVAQVPARGCGAVGTGQRREFAQEKTSATSVLKTAS
jgi:hypothetical protein